MLIKSLSLKDFKCFEQVDIDFGKITLLTGANSSGKSSLIYALLGIMQSKYFPQYFDLNGELINMGGFEDVVRKKSKYGEFEININLKDKYFKTTWCEDPTTEQPTIIAFHTDKYSVIETITIEDKELHREIDFWIDSKWKADKILEHYPEVKIVDVVENNTPYNDDSKNPFHLKGEVDDSVEVLIQYFIDDSNELFLDLIENDNCFNYIGSFRLPPERTYYRKPNARKISVNGEGYIDQIIKWEESNEEMYNELIEAVTEMGLFKTIQADTMKGGRFELNVQVNKNSELASLTDVGFGISQFLPIIVADLQMKDGSCLAISQPEIHLHPKIQATLGDYFCKQVNHTDKQYIVETHSEYLINRMRLLIVKGELKPEDVKLYYMENDGIKTTTYAIELTTDGQIKNAPQGFFDTYEMDVMDIALYASA
jgi:predicted ATPase